MRSARVRRRAAHQRDNLIGGHFKVTASAQTFNELLTPSLTTALACDLDQPDHTRLDLERDIRPRHKPRSFPDVLRDGDLSFGGDAHGCHLSY